MTITGYEIDFLPVGEKSSSGDAILFRYKEDGAFKIILIDGGYAETGKAILEHMRKYYYYPEATDGSQMRIDHIVCSHPDQDHVGGLKEVMEACDVGTFWINNPLDYISKGSLSESPDINVFSKNDAETVQGLIAFAKEQGIEVNKPLEGEMIGPLVVCSPSEEFYEILVKGELQRQGSGEAKFKTLLKGILDSAISLIPSKWGEDKLYEYPATSVCNESSTVLFGSLTDEEKILLTADAGIEALTKTHSYLEGKCEFTAGCLDFIQMPHHGGRHNVNATILDDLLGTKTPEMTDPKRGSSFVSVAKKSDDHPKKAVANAFRTRGYSCIETKGRSVCHFSGDIPCKDGWSPVALIEYFDDVESLEE